MASIEQLLSRWQDAGLLDQEAVSRVRAFEEGRATRGERPGVVEALVYLALAITGVGVVVLIASNWEHLGSPARSAIPGIAAVVALAAGWLMLRRPSPEVRRGGQAAWLLALALGTATVAIGAHEAGMEGTDTALLAALVAAPLSSVLWLGSKSHLQVVGLGGAAVLLSLAAAARAGEGNQSPTFGMSLVLLSFAGLAVTELGVLRPRPTARALVAVGLFLGSFYAAVDGPVWTETTSFVVGAVLITLSVRRGVFLYTAAGIATVFAGLAAAILRHVDDPTVASLALIAMGLLLLAGIVVLERIRPWKANRSHLGETNASNPR